MSQTINKTTISAWFKHLQTQIITNLETIENTANPTLYPHMAGKFIHTPWQRANHDTIPSQGGGIGALLKGRVFEKAGVHTSEVYGEMEESFAKQIVPGTPYTHFWAAGISLIIHPRNPHIPAIHMNTRYIVMQENAKQSTLSHKDWFGGGMDLTPLLAVYRDPHHTDSHLFHQALRVLCARHPHIDYAQLKKACDTYFHLPHRAEPRGIGGIFFDKLNSGSRARDFAFTQDVGRTFSPLYQKLVNRHIDKKWSDQEREEQLIQRGRYVEFNLLYDRGTTFGLKTGGNVQTILSSMPPIVHWP